MKKITPFLWFDANAEEAVDFYMTVFPNASKGFVLRGPEGKAITVSFEIEGQQVSALNGGPHHKLSEAFSFVIACKDQAELDGYWDKLLADGGQTKACGWLQDRFGLCWQVVPENIGELVKHPKAFQAMMGMIKLDIAALEAAGREG